jgi:glycosyltransferase involved in cell wall biosynthesis
MKYIVSPQVSYSGNIATANRIASYFSDAKVIDVDHMKYNYISSKDLIIGLHAYKVGKELIDKNYKFIIIITGTDLNCDFYEKEKKEIIIKVLNQAKQIIVFNQYQRNFLLENNINSIIIPQSVNNILPTNNFNLRNYLDLDINSKVFLLVGNLRKVKDPLFLLNEFKKLYDDLGYIFVYIGNNLDSYDLNYYWIRHINGLDKVSTFSAIEQADGLINTSLSEGMSSTILEAMKLNCPVYARVNNSNEYLIKHGYNGFLFINGINFYKIIKESCNDYIKKNAYNDVNKKYNQDIEKNKYMTIIKNLYEIN